VGSNQGELAQRRAKPSRFAALEVPNYRRFVLGQGVSLVGSWTETIAQGLLIIQLTNSPVALGIAAALRYLPVLVLGPYGGVIVDRHDRRRTLLVTQSLLGLLSLLLGVLALVTAVHISLVFCVAVAFGLLTAVDNPARMALIPELVGLDRLRNAITLNSTLANVGRGLGPVVAASLITTVGIGWCFIANAVSFAAVIATLATMHVDQIRPEPRARRSPGQLRAALSVVSQQPQLLGPLIMMAIVGTLTYEFEVSLPVFAEHALTAGPAEYAWLTAGFGAGAVIAGLLLISYPQTGLARMTTVTALYGVTLAATATAPSPGVANTLIVVVGACSIGFLVIGNSTIQLYAPAGMRGRVTSLWTTAFTGSTPFGALLIGGTAQLWGGRAALAVGAAACAVAAIAGLAVLSRNRRTAPERTLKRIRGSRSSHSTRAGRRPG
jgi:MFS family permease